MIKGFLAVDENLASSIALRFASRLMEILPLRLQAGHVAPSPGHHDNASGWGRRAWEEGVVDAGRQAVERLLNTEKVACPFIDPPKIFVGDRDESLLRELARGDYDLFLEGYLNTSDVRDFHRLVTSPLYVNSPCPMMVIKNLVGGRKVALLRGEDDDSATVFPDALRLLAGDGFDFELLSYRYRENGIPLVRDREKAGSVLGAAETFPLADNWLPGRSRVVSGTPEGVADMLEKYKVVVSSLPSRNDPRLELLAHCPSPVLLCH